MFGAIHPRANPIERRQLWISAGLGLVGVTGFVLGFRARGAAAREPELDLEGTGRPDRPSVPPSVRLGKAWLAVDTGGGPEVSTQTDTEIMRGGYHMGQFTSFFTREVEREILSRLQAYKNRHQISLCKPVEQVVDLNQSDLFRPGLGYKWLDHAEPAATEVLTDLYPTGRPWGGQQFLDVKSFDEAEETVTGWRWWLWWRVYYMAEREVCDFRPVT